MTPKPARTSLLWTLLDVRAGEERLIVLMFLHAACNGLANVLVGTAAMTLFVVKYSAALLPWTYLGVAIANPTVSVLFERMEQRLSFSRLLYANLGGLTLLVIALRVAIAMSPSGAPVMILAILYWTLFMLTNLEYWSLANRLFNVRQSKRLFGVIGSGEVVTRVAGGLAIPFLAHLWGAASLLVVGSAALFGSVLLVAVIVRTNAVEVVEEEATAEVPVARPPRFRELLRDRYVCLMFATASMYNVCYWFVDQIFYNAASLRYPQEAQLAAFCGVFQAISGVVALLSSLFLTGRLLGRWGVGVSLVTYPMALLIATGSLSVVSMIGLAGAAFWFAVCGNFLGETLIGSVYSPSFLVLYQPMTSARRLQVQTLGEGIVEPIAGGLAGALLLVLNEVLHVSTTQLAIDLTLFAGIWVGVGILMGRDYHRVLTESMSKRRLSREALDLSDASSLQALRQGLQANHPGILIYVMTILRDVDFETLQASLSELIHHPADEVRRYALRVVEEKRALSVLPAVEALIEAEPTPALRGMALQTLAAVYAEERFDAILPHLESDRPELRRGAMIGLLRCGSLEGILAAGRVLVQDVGAPEPARRALAAEVLGEVGSASFYRPLLQLLRDEDVTVRRTALNAAARLKLDRLWPVVLESLQVPAVQGAAMSALRQGGNPVIPLLDALFSQPEQNREVRLRALRIVRGIPGAASLAWLEQHLGDADRLVRHRILTELARRGYQAAPVTRPLCEQQMRMEAAWIAWCLAVTRDIAQDETAALLRSALHRQIAGRLERVFLWLSFLYDSRAVQKVYDRLAQGSEDRRAYAFEVLDVLLSGEHKAFVLPLVDELKSDVTLRKLAAALPHADLEPLSASHRLRDIALTEEEPCDAWLRTCAIVVMPPQDVPPRLLEDPDPLVRETAAWIQRGDSTIGTVQKVRLLNQVSIFSELPDEVLSHLAAMLTQVEADPGVRIVSKGEMGSSIYFIVQGKLRVHDEGAILAHLGEGQIFGETSVLDSEPRTASVTAEEPSILLCLEQDALYELMSDHPEVMRSIIRLLSGDLRARVQEIDEVSGQLRALESRT